mgnify:CR=1 FL=1|tara:strand:+ start:4185 stop:4949 length:765 start_codon:yes stop_codon:yes gene_type:complete
MALALWTTKQKHKKQNKKMAKKALSEEVEETETTVLAEASGEVTYTEGSATAGLTVGGLVDDLDASDIAFPRLSILQAVSKKAQEKEYNAGDIVLDNEFVLKAPIELTVIRIGKMYEENVDWDGGEIPRILTKKEAHEAGGSFEWGSNGQKPDWMPIADALIAIKGDDPEIYPFDYGKENYAFAMWRIKGVAYKRAAVKMFTAFRMYYREGFTAGTFTLDTGTDVFGNNTVVVPDLRRGHKNTPEFREWLADFS